MTIYQILLKMGKAPDQCVGTNAVTVFRANDGEIGIGLFKEFIAPNSQKGFRPIYRTKLEVGMLKLTGIELLGMVRYLHKLAELNGIEVKGEEV